VGNGKWKNGRIVLFILHSAFLIFHLNAFPGPEGLVARVTPEWAGKVVFEDVARKAGEKEFCEVRSLPDGRIAVKGNTPNAQCAGYGKYLRKVAKVPYFWEGGGTAAVAGRHAPPRMDGVIRAEAPYQWRAVFNFCTHSYSLAFADKARWERELDLLALRGVNLPLACTGVECVWYETLMSLGWSDEEARSFLVGPAFMAWQWMTNIESYAGPLPKSWIENRLALARFILARERELGMTPIQQGFTGNVPRDTVKKFPSAKIKFQPPWCGFPGSAQLDPLDPLFPKFARAFYAAEKKLFGLHGYYAVDPFHESQPPQAGDDYLRAVGETIGRELRAADPAAKACMQSWSIRVPILKSFPKDGIIVLDISGEKGRHTKGFWGYPFVTGAIINFGGRTASGGDIRWLAENHFAETYRKFPNCVGMGYFPEGIHTSPLYWEQALDLLWRDDNPEPLAWTTELLEARYGVPSATAKSLAEGLLATYYGRVHLASAVYPAKPTFLLKRCDPNVGFRSGYDHRRLLRTWREMITAAKEFGVRPGMRFDLVDAGHRLLSDLSYAQFVDVVEMFLKGDVKEYDCAVAAFLETGADEDWLRKHEPLSSLKTYLDLAAAQGKTDEERNLYTFNQAVQVTYWGPFGVPTVAGDPIQEYAWKEWGGLLSGYYLPRWKMFLEHARKVLEGKAELADIVPPTDIWQRPKHRGNAFYSKMADFEEGWIRDPKRMTGDAPTDDVVSACEKVLAKQAAAFEYQFENGKEKINGFEAKIAEFEKEIQRRIKAGRVRAGVTGDGKENDTADLMRQVGDQMKEEK